MALIAQARERQRTASLSRAARFKQEMAPQMSAGGVVTGPEYMGFGGGADEQERSLYRSFSGWPYASISLKAKVLAGLTFRVARKANKRGRKGLDKAALPRCLKAESDNLVIVENHPFLDLLKRPNPCMFGWHLKYILGASIDLVGQCHWWRTRDKGKKLLWPIPASWISPVRTQESPLAGWRISPGGEGEPFEVPANEVIYFYLPDPSDPTGVSSPTQATSAAITADESLQKAQAIAFRNGIRPGLAIIAGDPTAVGEEGAKMGRPLLEKEQRQVLNALIKKHYAGWAHADEPIILDRLIQDVKFLTNKPSEMDFLESGKSTKGRITQGYGVNPIVMGEVEGANRASSAEARKHTADFAVNPIVEMVSETLSETVGMENRTKATQLLVYLERYVPDDTEETRRNWDIVAKHKACSRRQLCVALTGMDPGEDFDSVIMGPQDEEVPVGKNGKQKQGTPQRKLVATRTKQQWDREYEDAEQEFKVSLEGFFRDMREDVLERLGELYEKQADWTSKQSAGSLVDWVFRIHDWLPRFREYAARALRRLMVRGAMEEKAAVAKAARRMNRKEEDIRLLLEPHVAASVDTEIATVMQRPYWAETLGTVRNDLARTLTEGVHAGEGLHELSVRVGVAPTVPGMPRGVLSDMSNTVRAELISRTETCGALNAGHNFQQQDLQRQGLIEGKQWSAMIDRYTRQGHIDANGQKVGVDAKFRLTGPPAEARFPGDFNLPAAHRCHCRCTSVSVMTAGRGTRPRAYSPLRPNMPDTLGRFTDASGNWSSERTSLHNRIIRGVMRGAETSAKPTAHFMGGGTASGKSNLVRTGKAGVPSKAVAIDSDAIKSELPEYARMVKAKNSTAAAFVHEESSYVSKEVLKAAADRDCNLLFDGTGDGSLAKLESKVVPLKQRGYRVSADYVTIDTEEAIRRSTARAAKTGRKVPDAFIREIHAGVSETLPKAIDRGLFDELRLWDNNGRDPLLILEQVGGKTTVHNEELWARFLAKATER